MKHIENLKEFIYHPWLCFDRSFSERGKMQLVWLGSVVLIVFSRPLKSAHLRDIVRKQYLADSFNK